MTRLISVLIAICVLSTQGLAQNSGQRRLSDREDLLGWEAVGRLDLGDTGFCTGTLIARDLVLTAAHCAFDARTGKPFESGAVTFRAGLHDGKSVADRKVVQIAVPPDFTARAGVSAERVKRDVALMRLDAPIGFGEANAFALHQGDISGSEVSVASYGRGRSEAITRQRSCNILRRGEGLIAFDCNITFGSSGSAILARSGPRWQILSVVSAGGSIGGRTVGFGMELPRIVSELKAILRRDAPRPQPTIKRLGVGAEKSLGGAKFIGSSGS